MRQVFLSKGAIFFTLLLSFLISSYRGKDKSDLQEGDLIFQSSKSEQSRAVELATDSRYSHMGILFRKGEDPYVYEAIGPVRSTRLNTWIDRGKKDHYVVKRLKRADSLLTSEDKEKMKRTGRSFAGKGYDPYFEWSDERIYCSELVWKIYNRALGIRIWIRKELSDLDLDHPLIKKLMKERYGEDIPMQEKVISPASMYRSDKLVTVQEGGR